MKPMSKILLVLTAVAFANSAHAAYLFGFSGYLASALAVNTASGSVIFETGDGAFSLNARNQGWWSDTQPNFDSNENYIVRLADGVSSR